MLVSLVLLTLGASLSLLSSAVFRTTTTIQDEIPAVSFSEPGWSPQQWTYGPYLLSLIRKGLAPISISEESHRTVLALEGWEVEGDGFVSFPYSPDAVIEPHVISWQHIPRAMRAEIADQHSHHSQHPRADWAETEAISTTSVVDESSPTSTKPASDSYVPLLPPSSAVYLSVNDVISDQSAPTYHVLRRTILLMQSVPHVVEISMWIQMSRVLTQAERQAVASSAQQMSIYTDLKLMSGQIYSGRFACFDTSGQANEWRRASLIIDETDTLLHSITLSIFVRLPALRVKMSWPPMVREREKYDPDAPLRLSDRHNISVPLQFSCPLVLQLPPLTQYGSTTFSGERLVTAVLVAWNRPRNVLALAWKLMMYGFIGEVIVWNNQKRLHFTRDDFMASLEVHLPQFAGSSVQRNSSSYEILRRSLLRRFDRRVRIYNAPNNLHDFSKWLACDMARYDTCYFQDDDWENCNLNALYAQFSLAPELVHSLTRPSIALEQRSWFLQDPSIGLHAGFAWLGAGSMFLRSHARSFLRQLGHTSLTFPSSQLLTADMLFCLWRNDPPYVLWSALTPFMPEEGTGWSAEANHWAILFRTVNMGARKMAEQLLRQLKGEEEESLPLNQQRLSSPFASISSTPSGSGPLFSASMSFPVYDARDSHSACASDACLFLSSYKILPRWSASATYDPALSVRHQNAFYRKLPLARNWKQVDAHGYQAAVDGDTRTLFVASDEAQRQGFYIGLDLLRPSRCKSITMHRVSGWSQGGANIRHPSGTSIPRLRVLVSLNNQVWYSLSPSETIVQFPPNEQLEWSNPDPTSRPPRHEELVLERAKLAQVTLRWRQDGVRMDDSTDGTMGSRKPPSRSPSLYRFVRLYLDVVFPFVLGELSQQCSPESFIPLDVSTLLDAAYEHPVAINLTKPVTTQVQSPAFAPASEQLLDTEKSLLSQSPSSATVTAVLLGWRRDWVWRPLLAHLSSFPFIVEIIVWNNNANATMHLDEMRRFLQPHRRKDMNLQVRTRRKAQANMLFSLQC